MARIEAIKQQMRDKLSGLSLAAVVELYEATEAMPHSAEVSEVRGVLMDEMESRNPEAFAAWIESNDPALIVTPSHFFTTG